MTEEEKDNYVTRTISLKNSNDKLFKWLDELPAVTLLSFDEKHELKIIYDATQLQWHILEQLFRRHGLYRSFWLNNFKSFLYNRFDHKIWKACQTTIDV